MFAHVNAAHDMIRRGLFRTLSVVVLGGLVACAQQDTTGPGRTPQAQPPKGAEAEPVLPPLLPWLQSSTWALSDLRGELLFSFVDTLYRVASHSAEPQSVMSFPYWPYAVHMSPDGTRAATLHFDELSGLLCVTDNGVGGRRHCVRNSSPRSTALAWSPDGQALVLGGDTQPNGRTAKLSVVDPATLESWTLLPNNDNGAAAQSVTFTPDAKTVSFVQNNLLWRMPMNGGVPQLQPGFESLRSLWAARWSPDGKAIALLSWNTNDHTLSVANADGSNLRVLARVPHVSDSYGMLLDRPVWSPDGEWLGLSASDCSVEPCVERIVVLSLGGKGARILTPEGLLHDWR